MEHIEDIIKELLTFAELGNDEVTEFWSAICDLWHNSSPYMSENLLKNLELEITNERDRAKRDFRIVEEEDTIIVKSKTLEYVGD